jgi:DNA-binding CsgD family transcriptional regulator
VAVLSARIPSIPCDGRDCSQLTVCQQDAQRAHLELLLPEAMWPVTRNLQDYALAYAEYYRGNLVFLNQGWDFLADLLRRSWRQGAYEVVARLASALAYPASGRRDLAEARHLLQLGIVASRRIRDRQRFASLLNRLGALTFIAGNYQLGHRLWYTGLYHIEAAGSPPGLWEPLYSFAQVADILGNYAAAQHFIDTFYHAPRASENHDSMAVALFVRGLYARFMGNMDRAGADFSDCLRLLVPRLFCEPSSAARQLFLLVVQAELARTQGQYQQALRSTEAALALAQACGDQYTFSILLIDQGVFACRMGWFDEVRGLIPRLRELESQLCFPNLAQVNRMLEQRLLEHGLLFPPTVSEEAEPLSAREREVLQGVAEGLSNREIAGRLVITTATVKKHLEHIYVRLDVHNRTAAVARARSMHIIS